MIFPKNKVKFLLGVFIIIIVYNAIVFLLPFLKVGSFWVGYSFSMTAFLLVTAVSLFYMGREGIKSKFYGLPLISISCIYLIIQIIIGLIFVVISIIPIPISLIINILLLGLYLIGLISADLGKGFIESNDKSVNEKNFYIKSIQTDVEILIEKTDDTILKKTLKELSETVRYSDPVSSEKLGLIEAKIVSKVTELSDAVDNGKNEEANNLCNMLQQLFIERNKKSKILK